jgi:hypothetical protein
MISHLTPVKTVDDDIVGLQESVRILAAVVVALSERIEILEARETLTRAGLRVVPGA